MARASASLLLLAALVACAVGPARAIPGNYLDRLVNREPQLTQEQAEATAGKAGARGGCSGARRRPPPPLPPATRRPRLTVLAPLCPPCAGLWKAEEGAHLEGHVYDQALIDAKDGNYEGAPSPRPLPPRPRRPLHGGRRGLARGAATAREPGGMPTSVMRAGVQWAARRRKAARHQRASLGCRRPRPRPCRPLPPAPRSRAPRGVCDVCGARPGVVAVDPLRQRHRRLCRRLLHRRYRGQQRHRRAPLGGPRQQVRPAAPWLGRQAPGQPSVLNTCQGRPPCCLCRRPLLPTSPMLPPQLQQGPGAHRGGERAGHGPHLVCDERRHHGRGVPGEPGGEAQGGWRL